MFPFKKMFLKPVTSYFRYLKTAKFCGICYRFVSSSKSTCF